MITFENVTKKFGSKEVLSQVSFTIKPGEFVFLTGPSGAGKTTIARLIIRDFIPSSGKLLVDSQDLTTLPAAKIPLLRRKVGVIFQDFKILFEKTALENVLIVQEILGKSTQEAQEKAQEALKVVGLQGKENFFPMQLSAGELQRICVARAIVNQPKILLADEPTGNLDPKTGWELIKLLDKINKTGTTILMATHNVDIVNSFNQRVISILAGKIVKDKKKGQY